MGLAIADKWFETRRVSDDVTLILEAHVDPWMRCNIWHVRGRDRDILVDSGMGLGSLKAEVAKLTDRPVLCIASHTHFDHIGGHHEFEYRLAHRADAGTLAAPDSRNTVTDLYVVSDYIHAVPDPGFDPAAYAIKPAPVTRLIDEGDVIDLGDRVFTVLHLPGHSPGSIALWEAETGTLFSGDVLYDGELLDQLYHSDIPTYLESLARLREFPVASVHAGHYGSFGRQRFTELIDAYTAAKA